jgi:hypothetical protein
MVVQKPCDNPGCIKGKITLFTSVKSCDKCGGTGYLVQTIQEYQTESEEDVASRFYKNSVNWDGGYEPEF